MTGYPKSEIRWTRLGKDLPRNVIYRKEKAELVLRSAKSDDSGTYECSAKNGAGIAKKSTTLWIERGENINSDSCSNAC